MGGGGIAWPRCTTLLLRTRVEFNFLNAAARLRLPLQHARHDFDLDRREIVEEDLS